MASTSQTTNHRIYYSVTGTLPPATMSRIPGEDAVKKIAQRAKRKMNPRPRAPVSLAGLVLEEEDCRTLRGAVKTDNSQKMNNKTTKDLDKWCNYLTIHKNVPNHA